MRGSVLPWLKSYRELVPPVSTSISRSRAHQYGVQPSLMRIIVQSYPRYWHILLDGQLLKLQQKQRRHSEWKAKLLKPCWSQREISKDIFKDLNVEIVKAIFTELFCCFGRGGCSGVVVVLLLCWRLVQQRDDAEMTDDNRSSNSWNSQPSPPAKKQSNANNARRMLKGVLAVTQIPWYV